MFQGCLKNGYYHVYSSMVIFAAIFLTADALFSYCFIRHEVLLADC